MKITIIICTYNRANLLNLALESVCKQVVGSRVREIIVVDNNSDDKTALIIKRFQDKEPKVKYVLEQKQGLSNARNRGAEEAVGDWLFFMDDDAKLVEGSLFEISNTVDKYDFDLFTGIWRAWYTSPSPLWLPNSTGNYVIKGDESIRDIGGDYVSGGVMVIHKQKLKDIGGFPTNLGMTGYKVAYGEESYVEEEFKRRGWKVGINPNIVIDHLVGEHKYKLSWHLEAAYAKGRDGQFINENGSKAEVMKNIISKAIFGWVKPLLKLIIRKKYYSQNFVIDYWGQIKYELGRLSAITNASK